MATNGSSSPWFSHSSLCLEEFRKLTSQCVDRSRLRLACDVQNNIPIYNCSKLDLTKKRELMEEWIWVLRWGPGALALRGAVQDLQPLEDASDVFRAIIAEEASGARGDHFAAAGANDRIWNSHEKLCLRAPDVFARYYANPWLDAVAEAWLGPSYQMTAQVNLIRPGGQAQSPHRDFHLGFQTDAVASMFPAHCHECLSPMLTLQGAVAHVDMPVESGPTKLLPFSQLYGPGYLAWRQADFVAHFEANYVQLPLQKGDALFFNPALFHAGGENRSKSIHRLANLLQVSSAMGRSMESLDRLSMSKALYPALLQLQKSAQSLNDAQLHAAVAACAEGYSFPGNLDLEVPDPTSMAPQHQQAMLKRALQESWPVEKCHLELAEQAKRKESRARL